MEKATELQVVQLVLDTPNVNKAAMSGRTRVRKAQMRVHVANNCDSHISGALLSMYVLLCSSLKSPKIMAAEAWGSGRRKKKSHP